MTKRVLVLFSICENVSKVRPHVRLTTITAYGAPVTRFGFIVFVLRAPDVAPAVVDLRKPWFEFDRHLELALGVSEPALDSEDLSPEDIGAVMVARGRAVQ